MATIKYHYYRKLDSESKEAYRRLASAIKSFCDKVYLPAIMNLSNVVAAVKADNPQLYYLNWSKIFYLTKFGSLQLEVNLKYLYGKNAVKAYAGQIRNLAASLKSAESDSTVKSVYDYLVKNVRYNYLSYTGGEYRLNDHNVIGPLFEKLGVCEGVAKAAQALLRCCDIECTVISGKARATGRAHAWNLIKYGDCYRYFDITWDLPAENEVRTDPTYSYFAKTKEEFLRTHIF